MSDKKISQFTELTGPSGTQDFVPIVDVTTSTTKKVALSNLPLSDLSKKQVPLSTTDIQAGVDQTRILNFITSTGDGYKNNTNLTAISIGSNVSGIGASGFENCVELSFVQLGHNVTGIERNAFNYCTELTKINLDNVESIGDNAFKQCNNLKNISLNNNLTRIGDLTFANCSSLNSITIPDSVTSLGGYCFAGLQGATEINIGNSVRVIGASAFYACESVTNITIPDSVTGIEDLAFSQSNNANPKLKTFTIGTGLTGANTIGNNTFSHCKNLTDIFCRAPKTAFSSLSLNDTPTNGLVIHARASDSTWTDGQNQSIGGNTRVSVIKDL